MPTNLTERYTLTRELGRGGMATVYVASDKQTGENVAVKILNKDFLGGINGSRFLREVEVMRTLSHPNILPLLDSGEVNQIPYYVVPLIGGGSLRDLLLRGRQLDFSRALAITAQLADALAFAHDRGILHRDIKPENILLDGDKAFLADFGIAKASAAAGESLTGTGISVGTPSYMSPEQVIGEKDLDARSDLYSLACVLYEMIAGEPPFVGGSTQAILAKRMAMPAPSVKLLRSSTPAHIVSALDRALCRAPADRYRSVQEFTGALTAAQPKPDGSQPWWPSRRNGFIGAGAVIAAIAIAGLIYAKTGRSSQHARASPASATRGTSDSVAYQLVVHAAAQANRRTSMAVARSLDLYNGAIKRDSTFAAAWAGYVRSLQFALAWGFPTPGIPRDSVIPLMIRASDRALEADSTLAESWLARAVVLREVDPGSRKSMIEAVQRAIKLDSMSADAWFILGSTWMDSLETEKAIVAYRRSLAINPGFTNALAFLGLQYYWKRDFDSALIWVDSAKRVDAAHVTARSFMGQLRRARGEWSLAEAEYEAVLNLGSASDRTMAWAGLAELAFKRGERTKADTLLRHALSRMDTLNPVLHDATSMAWGFAATNQPAHAIAFLERFSPRKSRHFQVHLLRDPQLDPLRGIPRFDRLITRGALINH